MIVCFLLLFVMGDFPVRNCIYILWLILCNVTAYMRFVFL
jgi:hypothetical protein